MAANLSKRNFRPVRPNPARPLGRLTNEQSLVLLRASKEPEEPVTGSPGVMERLFLAGILCRDTQGSYFLDEAGLKWIGSRESGEALADCTEGARSAPEAKGAMETVEKEAVPPLPPSKIVPAHSRLQLGEKKNSYKIFSNFAAWQANTRNGVLRMIAEALRHDPYATGEYAADVWVEVDNVRLWVRSADPAHVLHKDFQPLVREFEEMAGIAQPSPRPAPAPRRRSRGGGAPASQPSPAKSGSRPLGAKAKAALEVLKANPRVAMSVLQIELAAGYLPKQMQGVLATLADKPDSGVVRADTEYGRRGFMWTGEE